MAAGRANDRVCEALRVALVSGFTLYKVRALQLLK